MVSEERAWQLEKIREAAETFTPSMVLEVGYPKGASQFLDLWGCEVVTVDPFVGEADFVEPFENWQPTGRFDLVNLTSVVDYFNDPVFSIRKAGTLGDVVLVQGRLNTYKHPNFNTQYWAPTKRWVSERAAKELGLVDVEWLEFLGDQMFSICGETR